MKEVLNISLIIVVTIMSFTNTKAQNLPPDFITKVTYSEYVSVIYEMPDSNAIHCLTLAELSNYHAYSQIFEQTELVDSDGDLLTETTYLNEYNVRDEWMEPFSKVVVAKDSLYVLDANENILSSSEREIDSNDVFLNTQQSEEYELYVFDSIYLNNLLDTLITNGIAFTDSNNIITATMDDLIFVYDHNTKSSFITEYDSNGYKASETALEYLLQEDDIYVPYRKTIITWFWSKKGCCIKKTVVHEYINFERVTGTSSTPKPKVNKNLRYEVSMIVNSNKAVVNNIAKSKDNKPLSIVIYDMAGKRIYKGNIELGVSFTLPTTSRNGMYLMHLFEANNPNPVLGKVLMSQSNNKF